MDAISYSYADKQAKRIKKFIENPDSTSGILTQPAVIQTGETVTVPVGRVAVLPNVQVDGVLNIEGEVFVPSGATFGDLESQLSLKAPLASPALTGNPTAPTQTAGNNSTSLATTAYVDGKMVLGTAVNVSGTSVDFTGIPSWAKKLTIIFDGVSTNGTSYLLYQVGTSSGIITSGYIGSSVAIDSALSYSSYNNGFLESSKAGTASYSRRGCIELIIDGLKISEKHQVSNGTGLNSTIGCGTINLVSALTTIRITTVNGTDTFDAGSINILYEG